MFGIRRLIRRRLSSTFDNNMKSHITTALLIGACLVMSCDTKNQKDEPSKAEAEHPAVVRPTLDLLDLPEVDPGYRDVCAQAVQGDHQQREQELVAQLRDLEDVAQGRQLALLGGGWCDPRRSGSAVGELVALGRRTSVAPWERQAFHRTARGGAYGSGSGACRSAFRFEQSPRQGFVHSGFRVVVEPQTLGVRNDPLSAGTILLEGCSLGLLLNNEQKLVNCESISELPQTDFSVKSVEVRGKTVSPGLLQSISLLSELEELTLFNVHLPANSLSLSTIAGLSRLRVLNIHGDERTGQVELNDFASLAQLKLLTHLYFDLTDLSDLDVSSFGKMNNLTHLSISGTDITDKALASISDFPQLEYLNFSHTSVTDRGLQMLQRHLTLKELSVANTDVTSAGVISMLKSSEVDHLRAIGRQVAFDESESPDCIQNLKTLVISQADSLSFQWLQNAHNLETLWVTSSSEIDADFGNRLSQAPIHELRFEKCKFGSNSLVGLRKLTNLKTLSVIHCEIPSGEVEALKDLLPELTISTD